MAEPCCANNLPKICKYGTVVQNKFEQQCCIRLLLLWFMEVLYIEIYGRSVNSERKKNQHISSRFT